MQGEQPNTYDISFYGPNMYVGGLWLAALRAAEEMAKLQGEAHLAQELRELFEQGSKRYDELLWNGEYYIQLPDPDAPPENQFGDGCLADQLFGQWWAHLLELGYILPEEHVKTTLRSVVTYNFRQGFRGFEHGYRVFADRGTSGVHVAPRRPSGGPGTLLRRGVDRDGIPGRSPLHHGRLDGRRTANPSCIKGPLFRNTAQPVQRDRVR